MKEARTWRASREKNRHRDQGQYVPSVVTSKGGLGEGVNLGQPTNATSRCSARRGESCPHSH